MDLTWGLYFPLILIAIAYGVVSAAAGVMSGRGNDERAERARDVAFLILALGGVWVVILTVLALISQPDDIGDILIITLVIVVFFAILLIALFGLSMLTGRISRGASRRKRVTTDEL